MRSSSLDLSLTDNQQFYFFFMSFISSSVKTLKYIFERNAWNVLLESSFIVITIDCPNLVVVRTAFVTGYGLFFCISLMLIARLQVVAENRLMGSICQRTWFYTSVAFTAQIYRWWLLLSYTLVFNCAHYPLSEILVSRYNKCYIYDLISRGSLLNSLIVGACMSTISVVY